MESRILQLFSFLVVAVSLSLAAVQSLSDVSATYFYPLVISRLLLALAGGVLFLYVYGEKEKSLPEGSVSLVFLIVALSESFQAYLQANVTGLSYAILSVSLVISSSISFLSLRTSLVSMLPSQLTILAAPLLSLPLGVWSDRVLTTQALLMPVVALLMSTAIWLCNSVYVHRKTVTSKVKSMHRRQELLQAQMLLLRKQPLEARKSIVIEEVVREKVVDDHASVQQQNISDQVLFSELIEILREAVSEAQVRLIGSRPLRMGLDLPAPMTLPIAVAAERGDLKAVFASALNKSIGSLNGDQGIVRVSARVGYKSVSVAIEDNGWGLREKFSSSISMPDRLELSLREIQGVVSFWGGRLEVLSRLGVGSRMNIELTRVDAYSTDADSKTDLKNEAVHEFKVDPSPHITIGS